MDNSRKRKLLVWAMIVLVIVNITSLASIWYHRFQFRQMRSTEMRAHRQDADRFTKRNSEIKKFSERYSESLHLNENQSKEIDSIHLRYGKERRQIGMEMGKLKKALGEKLTADDINQDSLQALSEQQSILFNRMNQNTIDMNIAIRSVLQPDQIPAYIDQLKKLEQRRNSHRSTDTRRRYDN